MTSRLASRPAPRPRPLRRGRGSFRLTSRRRAVCARRSHRSPPCAVSLSEVTLRGGARVGATPPQASPDPAILAGPVGPNSTGSLPPSPVGDVGESDDELIKSPSVRFAGRSCRTCGSAFALRASAGPQGPLQNARNGERVSHRLDRPSSSGCPGRRPNKRRQSRLAGGVTTMRELSGTQTSSVAPALAGRRRSPSAGAPFQFHSCRGGFGRPFNNRPSQRRSYGDDDALDESGGGGGVRAMRPQVDLSRDRCWTTACRTSGRAARDPNET